MNAGRALSQVDYIFISINKSISLFSILAIVWESEAPTWIIRFADSPYERVEKMKEV